MTKTKKMILCALFAAIIAVTAPFSVFIGPVPVTAVLFSLALAAFVMGSRMSAAATAVYIFMGIAGLPVFSNFKGGIGAVMTPTGGFVFSYIFVVIILGQCAKEKKKSTVMLLCAAALLVCYAFGTLWYVFVTKSGVVTALMLCVVPFIPFDVLKLYAAYIVARKMRKRIEKQM